MYPRFQSSHLLSRLILPVFGLALAALACSLISGPKFVNHPRPPGSLSFEAFEGLGCGTSESGWACEPDSAIRAMGCHDLAEPSALLAGLQPDYPIMACLVKPLLEEVEPYEKLETLQSEASFLYWEGGFLPVFYRYVILVDGAPVLLSTAQDVQDRFAPIDTPEEALAYALALSSAGPRFGLTSNPDLDYSVAQLEDTHVEVLEDGYAVNLYSYQLFGCGPHWTTEIIYHVTRDGSVETQSSTQVFRNPEQDGLCVD
jgi:hypothetical protein